MLHILCPNTAIDVRIELKRFRLGEVQRASGNKGFASGKGINSSYACNFLGKKANLHAMVGELDQDYFHLVSLENITQNLVPLSGETRRNLTIVDANGLVAHIQTTGFEVSKKEVEYYLQTIEDGVVSGDTVLISGSLPIGFSGAKFQELIESLNKIGVIVIVDTDLGRITERGFLPIDFVKPNIEELLAFAEQHKIFDFKDIHALLKTSGVRSIIVTCGEQGSFLFKDLSQPVLFTRSEFEGGSREAIGSGDAFIGVFAAMISEGVSEEIALLNATSAGHSNIFHEGPGRIGLSFFEIFESARLKIISGDHALEVVNKIMFD